MEIIDKIAKKYGMKVIREKGSLFSDLVIAYGIIENYYVAIKEEDGKKIIIKINIDSETDRENLMKFTRKFKNSKKHIEAANDELCYVKIVVNLKELKEIAAVDFVKEIIDKFIEFLKSENFKSRCAYTGNDYENIVLTTIVNTDEEEFAFIGESAYREKQKEMEEDKEKLTKTRENPIFGIVGAALGTIPGILLWIILGRLRLFGWFASALIGIGATMGYKGLAKKMNIVTSIIAIGFSVAGTWGAHYIDTVFDVKKAFKEDGRILTFGEASKALKYLMENDSEIKKEVLFNPYFIIGLVIALVFAIILSINCCKASKGNFTIKRH